MDPDRETYIPVFEKQMRGLFRAAIRLVVHDPRRAGYLLRAHKNLEKAAARRRAAAERGLQVPAVLLISVTDRCNLACEGCYARHRPRPEEPELTDDELRQILRDGRELGIGIVFFAGGEPLLRPGLVGIAREFPEIVFPVFTNGLLIDAGWLETFRREHNLVPILSLEGNAPETDLRRGEGVYGRVRSTFQQLRKRGILAGCSLTITRENFDLVTGEAFVRELIGAGCHAFFFVEYVPIQEGTEEKTLTGEQKIALIGILDHYRETSQALFIGFPGDETDFGGCLAAGRGFLHISATGRLEPCPFAPYSDSHLRKMPLREALKSSFLQTIRANHHRLEETRGGCALWQHRDWLESLLKE